MARGRIEGAARWWSLVRKAHLAPVQLRIQAALQLLPVGPCLRGPQHLLHPRDVAGSLLPGGWAEHASEWPPLCIACIAAVLPEYMRECRYQAGGCMQGARKMIRCVQGAMKRIGNLPPLLLQQSEVLPMPLPHQLRNALALEQLVIDLALW
jgi:hypothetical protein